MVKEYSIPNRTKRFGHYVPEGGIRNLVEIMSRYGARAQFFFLFSTFKINSIIFGNLFTILCLITKKAPLRPEIIKSRIYLFCSQDRPRLENLTLI